MFAQVDSLIVCGGMAFTFKKTLEQVSIGDSLFDEPGSQKVASLVEKAKAKNVELVFPVDYITADKFDKDATTGTATDKEGIPDGWMGLDAGEESRKRFAETIKKAKTVLWNGPAGVFEFEKFAGGSKATLDACIAAKEAGATVIVGGGASALLCVCCPACLGPAGASRTCGARWHGSDLLSPPRRRHGDRLRQVWRRRQALAHLDRRRRVARAPRGQGASSCSLPVFDARASARAAK